MYNQTLRNDGLGATVYNRPFFMVKSTQRQEFALSVNLVMTERSSKQACNSHILLGVGKKRHVLTAQVVTTFEWV